MVKLLRSLSEANGDIISEKIYKMLLFYKEPAKTHYRNEGRC